MFVCLFTAIPEGLGDIEYECMRLTPAATMSQARRANLPLASPSPLSKNKCASQCHCMSRLLQALTHSIYQTKVFYFSLNWRQHHSCFLSANQLFFNSIFQSKKYALIYLCISQDIEDIVCNFETTDKY